MSDRYRFGSDTNRQLFEDALEKRGVSFSSEGWDVRVDDYVADIGELLRDFGGYVIAEDKTFEATSGGQDAGLQDTASTFVRSNPDDKSRGAVFPDHSNQIASQGGFPPRRTTWCQPDIPVLPAGLVPRER
jgi:hypothetical protein